MLSSKDGLFDRARGRIVGSEQYLTKPFTRDELLGRSSDMQARRPDSGGMHRTGEAKRMAKILIVDDSPTELHVLTKILQQGGTRP